jgi:hypothetical protein
VDVAIQTGSAVAIAGHVAAIVGAIVALRVTDPGARRAGADQPLSRRDDPGTT